MNTKDQDFKCKFCGRICCNINGLKNHEIRCSENPNAIENLGNRTKGRTTWNKGLTKYEDERILKISKSIQKHYENIDGTFKGRTHTDASKRKISQKMLGNHHNDPSKTGRGKKGIYKGFYCGSTYELAFVIYCLDNNIDIKKCPYSYTYEYNGKQHVYYPDFIIDNTIYEVKGYWTELVDIKTKAVQDRPIKVIYRKDMMYVFDYINKTYGKVLDKNIEDLYEERR